MQVRASGCCSSWTVAGGRISWALRGCCVHVSMQPMAGCVGCPQPARPLLAWNPPHPALLAEGHTVPLLAKAILAHNAKVANASARIPLQGIAVGNPWVGDQTLGGQTRVPLPPPPPPLLLLLLLLHSCADAGRTSVAVQLNQRPPVAE